MEDMTVYFAKLNLSSTEIFKVLNKNLTLNSVLQALHYSIKSEVHYQEMNPIPLTDEEKERGVEAKFETIDYKIIVSERKTSGIEGVVFKTSKLYYNELRFDNSLGASAVNNTEAIRFYLDTFNEYIGFNTKNRFGYQQFANSFEKLINKCLEMDGYTYKFSVCVYTDGLNLYEIKQQLKSINNIQKLEIKMQPPNPDDELLSNYESSNNTRIQELEEAKASLMSILIESTGEESLKIDSKLVTQELNAVEEVYGAVNTRKAVSRGYVRVKAENRNGVAFTSDSNRPKNIKCDKENFVERIKNFIAQTVITKHKQNSEIIDSHDVGKTGDTSEK